MPFTKPFRPPTTPVPLNRCYWVVDNLLLAGAYPGHSEPKAHIERVTGLWKAGMRTFINLMEENEVNSDNQPFVRYDDSLRDYAAKANQRVACLRFPIPDRKVTTVDRMQSILDAIDLSLSQNIPVYVHCFGGIGRTGTVISCWLLRHGLATKENVLEVLTKLRQADVERSWREAPRKRSSMQFRPKLAPPYHFPSCLPYQPTDSLSPPLPTQARNDNTRKLVRTTLRFHRNRSRNGP